MIAPELARLAEQAKEIAGVSIKRQDQHHNLSLTVLSREEDNVSKLTATIASYTNPFTQPQDSLFNLVTKVVMPEEVKSADLCAQSTEGAKLVRAFVTERIQKGNENLWLPMKSAVFEPGNQPLKRQISLLTLRVVELQKDRCLFARMMVVCKSRPEFNQQEALGTCEFSLVPRSLLQQMVRCCIAQPKVH